MDALGARLSEALSDRYVVDREVGRGGMSTVYAARDVKHDRSVALKVLHPNLVSERFLIEIRTMARLRHPHILPLYDSGQAAGLLFFVMPLVDGESLRDRLTRQGPMQLKEATRIVTEVASALSYAHAAGVVHRDIKPENIMLESGHALVMDFGIARALKPSEAQHLTKEGAAIGTLTYMSPEQAGGEGKVDERSDIYSLGCVMYEMLVGEPPFSGTSLKASLFRRLLDPPPTVSAKRPSIPYSVDAAIRTAMATNAKDRYRSAAHFADALASAPGSRASGEDVLKCIAVLPFVNMSSDADTEFFSDGITEEILNALVRLPGLRVIARTSSFAFKGQNVDIREVGRRLGAGTVLEGSVRKAGSRLRITAQLIDAAHGHHLWSERYDRQLTDVFEVQDEITAAIRDALSEKLLGLGSATPKPRTAIDPETFELLLRGRFFMARRAEGIQKGMEFLGQVLARAPGYAPAYVELASAYGILTIFGGLPPRIGGPKQRELVQAALSLDPNLSRAHAELGNVALWFDWDWTAAQRHYERAVALDPNDPWVSTLVGHFLSSLGRHDEAIAQHTRARSLDPLNPSVGASLASAYYLARRYQEAVAVCDGVLEYDPLYSDAHRIKGGALREQGRFEEAAAATEAAERFSWGHPWAVALRGMLGAASGHPESARAVAEALIHQHETSTTPPLVPPFAIALVLAQMGDADRYFEWMERSLAARDGWLVMLESEPALDAMRKDPRHASLRERIGVPQASHIRIESLSNTARGDSQPEIRV
jgi:serine/threonine-protein kinase